MSEPVTGHRLRCPVTGSPLPPPSTGADGDPALPAPLPRRVLRGRQIEIAHQLARGVKPRDVSEFGHEDHRDPEFHPPQGLDRLEQDLRRRTHYFGPPPQMGCDVVKAATTPRGLPDLAATRRTVATGRDRGSGGGWVGGSSMDLQLLASVRNRGRWHKRKGIARERGIDRDRQAVPRQPRRGC